MQEINSHCFIAGPVRIKSYRAAPKSQSSCDYRFRYRAVREPVPKLVQIMNVARLSLGRILKFHLGQAAALRRLRRHGI